MLCGPNEQQMITAERQQTGESPWGSQPMGLVGQTSPVPRNKLFPRDKYTAFSRDLGCQSRSTAGPLAP